ncbi:MAG: DUF2752 domain-containing protein [Prevotellaceae bacterium]|nr:DUF2752 domain-containing protein [Prevotellaceae bacterium]
MAIAIGVVVGAGLFYVFNPAEIPFPPCPFYKLTGFQCPGCGTQRALHSLLHGEWEEAFLYNPILIPALALIALLLYLNSFDGKKRFPTIHRILSGSAFIWGMLAVIILYWIGRNAYRFFLE